MSKKDDVKTGTVVEVVGEIKAYDPFRAELAEMQKNNATLVFDYENKKGQKEARSHIFMLRKSKAALEGARKDAKTEALARGRLIDSEAKAIETVILDMIDVHLAPVEEAEQREENRMHVIACAIESICQCSDSNDEHGNAHNAEALKANLTTLNDIEIGDRFDEFTDEAQGAKDRAITKLNELIATVTKAESDAKELEALREGKRMQDEKERQEREAKEKAEHDERIREEARLEEKRKSDEREAELVAEAEQAEKDKKDAAALAEQNKADAIRLTEERLKRESAESESARLAKEETERKAAEKKAANTAHQKKINNEAVTALKIQQGLTEADAKKLIVLIATGKITNIKILY